MDVSAVIYVESHVSRNVYLILVQQVYLIGNVLTIFYKASGLTVMKRWVLKTASIFFFTSRTLFHRILITHMWARNPSFSFSKTYELLAEAVIQNQWRSYFYQAQMAQQKIRLRPWVSTTYLSIHVCGENFKIFPHPINHLPRGSQYYFV